MKKYLQSGRKRLVPDRIIRWLSRARNDLRSIQAFISQDNPSAATRMVLQIVQQTEKLQAFPLSFEAIHTDRPEYRSMIIRPYAVLYRVTADEILILRVIHTSMRWK